MVLCHRLEEMGCTKMVNDFDSRLAASKVRAAVSLPASTDFQAAHSTSESSLIWLCTPLECSNPLG